MLKKVTMKKQPAEMTASLEDIMCMLVEECTQQEAELTRCEQGVWAQMAPCKSTWNHFYE